MENIPTQSNTGTEKLEQELADLEHEQKEKRGSDVELIHAEIEKIREEIEQKKNPRKSREKKVWKEWKNPVASRRMLRMQKMQLML